MCKLIYECVIKAPDHTLDIPKKYRVYESATADGGCIIEAQYEHDERWYVNPSCRALIKHFVDNLAQLKKFEEQIQAWRSWILSDTYVEEYHNRVIIREILDFE
ncbi:MAG: hypothetical protein GY757_18750 [bacterium]|nr:hypothetical protein [bacterium]